MDRLKLLQDGYDEDEFDNDFFDDEEDDEETDNKIYNECMTILHKGDEEFDKVVEENNKEIEQLYEEIQFLILNYKVSYSTNFQNI